MYNIKFEYMPGDELYDLVSGKKCHVLGVYYSNGRNPFNDENFFHRVVYYIDSELFDGVREEEQLEKIK